MAEISIPNFEFSAFYYPQLIDALLAYKRINMPELTDESEHEASVQFMRAFALVGHLNNVLIDLIANESTLPTAQLPETVRNMLRLIGYELRSASPAKTDLVYQLSKVFTSSFDLIPAGAAAATPRDATGTAPIYFEALDGIAIGATDVLSVAYISAEGPLDVTTYANSGSGFSLIGSVGAKYYFGQKYVMWDKFNITMLDPAEPDSVVVAWEFYDGNWNDAQPDNVVASSNLTLQVNGLLGTVRRNGATVRVQLNDTGAYEDCISLWDGSVNYIVTTSLLGQSSPSTDTDDYTVGTLWQELDGVVDGTNGFSQSGDVSFTLPQNETRNWVKTTLEAFSPDELFYIRFRIIELSGPGTTTFGRIRIDTGKQYVIAQATQGRTVLGETLGSSNGAASQEFFSQQTDVIFDSQEIRVDGEPWTRVTNFLNSESQDKHYVMELSEGDRARIKFGDGVTGKIPPIGQANVVMDYRIDADADGNVGANTVTIDKQGLTFVERLFNPRGAVGWAEAQSKSTASLEQAKIEGPASLRIKEVAISPDDVEDLAVAFIDSTSSKPFGRAKAIEEAYGPKTIGVVAVARGGGQASTDQLEELQTYFNGDDSVDPPVRKHLVANQEAVASNFTPRTIDVVATVYGPSDITPEQVVNHLTAVLQPEALKEDGVAFLWDFGGEVAKSRIEHEIFLTDPRISKVVLSSPSIDTLLGARELPAPGNITITVVPTN